MLKLTLCKIWIDVAYNRLGAYGAKFLIKTNFPLL